MGASCADLNNETACVAECGGEEPDPTYPNLLDSCTALCTDGLQCIKAADAELGDSGICTTTCGTVFDCDPLEGQKGVDIWDCEDNIQGANKACVPFGW
jgi:hypothetical protein